VQRERAREALEAQAKSVEGQLRQARFEMGQLELRHAAQEDEVRALKQSVHDMSASVTAKGAKLADLATLPRENERLATALAAAEAAAREAREMREEAERDITRKVGENKALLERLLLEQRAKFAAESVELHERVAEETEKRQRCEAEMGTLNEALGRARRECEAETAQLQREVERLRHEQGAPAAARDATPQGAREKKKGLLAIDLDESPGAKPIAEQLAEALRSHSTRVLDLFRSWDTDGDGEVSRAEFHKAMDALGFEVPRKTIDDLFTEWDLDGGGTLSYNELSKVLKGSRLRAAGTAALAGGSFTTSKKKLTRAGGDAGAA